MFSAKKNTSHMEEKSSRATPDKSISFFNRLTGTGLNPEIAYDSGWLQFLLACTIDGGIVRLAQHYFAQAKKSKYGIVQTWIVHNPIMFVTDPDVSYQIIRHHNRELYNSEADGVQERFFGKGTIISLDKSDPRYAGKRKSLMAHLFFPMAQLMNPMQRIFSRNINGEIMQAAESGKQLNAIDLAKRMAFSAIGETQLGFYNVTESSKTEYADRVLQGVTSLSNPIYIFLFTCQKKGNDAIAYVGSAIPPTLKAANSLMNYVNQWMPEFNPSTAEKISGFTKWGITTASSTKAYFSKSIKNLWQQIPEPITAKATKLGEKAYEFIRYPLYVDRLAYRGEKLLKKIIRDNEDTVLERMKSILGNETLTKDDLYKDECLSTMKLFLTGGFDTTSKAILFMLVLQADPAQKEFVELMLQEIDDVIKATGRLPSEWKKEDIDSLKYVSAFMHEIFRFLPSFSHQRNTAKESFYLTMQDGVKIYVPAETIFIRSIIDLQRNQKKWGADAEKFNPWRMLNGHNKPFNIDTVHGRDDIGAFGNDDRVCPGRKFANYEGILIGAMVAHAFALKAEITMKVKGKVRSITLDEALNPGFTLELKKGVEIFISFSKRRAEEKLAPATLGLGR